MADLRHFPKPIRDEFAALLAERDELRTRVDALRSEVAAAQECNADLRRQFDGARDRLGSMSSDTSTRPQARSEWARRCT